MSDRRDSLDGLRLDDGTQEEHHEFTVSDQPLFGKCKELTVGIEFC